MRRTFRVFLYFSIWILLALICIVLNIINIDWGRTDTVNGILIVVVLGVLQGSVLEFPVQTIATLIIGGERREAKRAPCDRLTVILNYNLLATGKDDILECIETMYMAFVGNLSPNVSAVLVSATGDEELKEYELQIRDTYRAILYDDLYREGLAFARGEYDLVDPIHLHNVWAMYVDVERNVFVTEYLEDICDRYAREFMVVHRVSRVLRKCGQYQDLMLLSEGEFEAYSYCDCDYYGRSAREVGEALFHPSEDVSNIFERKFDYTLVLDADTGIARGSVFEMLKIAAANPERGIIQPSIKLHCTSDDTLFMHLESMRQSIYEPLTNAIMALFDQSSYFGKALIKNKLYIDNVIGTKNNLIERVPVDVLSHDTFEASLLKPLYAGSVYLLEAPSHNYVTWNIRERRWNRGEILLAMYFWKHAFGKPMRWIQHKLQKSKFNKTKVRTESKLDFVTSYIAHSALRQMLMKPALLLYILLHIAVHLRYRYASIIIVMFSVLVFPKFATCNRENYKYVVLETIASIFQFTPEALVGCVRIWRALYANISLNAKWVPQRAVEEDFKNSNPFISSFKHLWGYSLFSLVVGILVMIFLDRAMLVLVMLITTFVLPLFTGFTSLTPGFQSCKRKKKQMLPQSSQVSVVSEDSGTNILSDGDLYKSLGTTPIESYANLTMRSQQQLNNAPNSLKSSQLIMTLSKDKTRIQTTSWSRDVEDMIAGSERLGPMLPDRPVLKQKSRPKLNKRTFPFDESSGDDRYVSIINVTPNVSSTDKHEIDSTTRSSSNDYEILNLSRDSYSTLSPKSRRSSLVSENAESNSNSDMGRAVIEYKDNITFITIGDLAEPTLTRKDKVPVENTRVGVRRHLSGKTDFIDTDTDDKNNTQINSVEKLYRHIGVLKQFTSKH
ncbi:uncharacterized protein LOC128210397 [Mya arenaria]|uniref:uncharacterized protein LOC128210397 n=1 Tax=Mya arenaria TaxID=6604 RepID=UPI0022DF5AC2|nr:uncharacterized protein LOC128210397 [Mya arenaria]